MSNIGIIRYSTVLSYLLMQCCKQYMSLITITQIAAVHRIVNVRRRLAVVVTTTVEVVKLEAYTQFFPHIYTKKSLEVVLTVNPISAIVVRKISER